jgi:hypothetical protein
LCGGLRLLGGARPGAVGFIKLLAFLIKLLSFQGQGVLILGQGFLSPTTYICRHALPITRFSPVTKAGKNRIKSNI